MAAKPASWSVARPGTAGASSVSEATGATDTTPATNSSGA